MKKILFLLFGILLLASCEKEAATPVRSEANQALDFRSEKVTILHKTGSTDHPWEIIEVSEQAWAKAHMDHGDYLINTVTLPDGSKIYVHPTDNSQGISWSINNFTITEATDDWDGLENTNKIVAALGGGDYAAKVCADLSGEDGFGFDDWYLPSKGELNAMYEQLGPEGTNGGAYWSSTEESASEAWLQFFFSSVQQTVDKKGLVGANCRCVRR